jgi:hypothetical protein
MNIKYGDIEYFTLLHFRDSISSKRYDKLDLVNLDKLRHEVHLKIEAIHEELKTRKPLR